MLNTPRVEVCKLGPYTIHKQTLAKRKSIPLFYHARLQRDPFDQKSWKNIFNDPRARAPVKTNP